MESIINQSLQYIDSMVNFSPDIGIILGSGLGDYGDSIDKTLEIPYEDIPGLPVSTISGHRGRFVLGRTANKNLMIMQGRVHLYEGYPMEKITLPIRIMIKKGIKVLIVTNAAGGINRDFKPGDLMLITDHINLMGDNPLIGPNLASFGPRFPDMSAAYDKELINTTLAVGQGMGLDLKKGIYAGLKGPSYETPAEIEMLRRIGADAVGMSTVPEVIVARHSSIRTLAISCISNMAAGIMDRPLNHQEVMDTAEKIKPQFMALLDGIIRSIEI